LLDRLLDRLLDKLLDKLLDIREFMISVLVAFGW
jgi:hypothetical protein